MHLLTVNTGSTSVKLKLWAQGQPVAARSLSPQTTEPAKAIAAFTGSRPVAAAAHRVVHGGSELTGPTRIDEQVLATIERLGDLAPLHNPVAARWIRAARQALPTVTQVALFDTAFFRTLPERAWRYALPREIADRYRIRRFGFHGLAHQGMLRSWQRLHPDRGGGGRLVTLQLGGGSSISAIHEGRAIDTSMGFSPLEGLVMATRGGDIDPGALIYLSERSGYTPSQLEDLLYHRSGLFGLAGTGDMAHLLADDSAPARVAIDIYCYRACKYIGSYLAALGGADGIVFGGGVGENAPEIRRRILAPLNALGIRLDPDRNNQTQATAGRISTDDSVTEVWAVSSEEDRVMVEETARLLSSMHTD